MTYKEEAPRRIAVLQKGLKEDDHYIDNSIPSHHAVNVPVRAQGKIIGYLRDHAFIKRVQASKHMLRKPPGWCISKEAFCEQIMSETKNIIVEDTESGLVYECPTEVFAEQAFEIQRGNFEPQLALGLKSWTVRNNHHHQPNLWGGDRIG